MKLTIKEPYIEHKNNKIRLCADIVLPTEAKTMYFEVEREYGKYLCEEVADAFVVGMLNYAFAKGYDIVSEAPVSERLLYQLETYYLTIMPTVRKNRYHNINLSAAPYKKAIESAGAVGTSASGGVDSFYSIVRHINRNTSEKYCLTHLLIANQFNFYSSEKETRKRFDQLIENTKNIQENYNLPLIGIYTNHYDFLFDGFVQEYSLRICSYSLALQKLFSVYYVSSGVPFKEFNYEGHDSDSFDIFNLALLSTDTLTFYSSGGEVTRTQKIAYFADDPFIQKNLKVCTFNDEYNCSICEKCLRTMLSLDIIGKLGLYTDSFDINSYKLQKSRFLATVVSSQLEASSDLLENMKKYHFHIPIIVNIYGRTIKKLMIKTKNQIKKIKLLRKIYFALKLDYLIYGKEKAMIFRYGSENHIYQNNEHRKEKQ